MNYTLTADPGAFTVAGVGAKKKVGSISDQGVTVADAFDVTYRPGATINETIKIGSTFSAAAIYGLSMVEGINVGELFALGMPALLTETVGVNSALTALLGVVIAEDLRLVDTLSPNGRIGATLLEAIRFSDALTKFLEATIYEGMVFRDFLTPQKMASVVIDEGVSVRDALTPLLLISVTMDEGLEFTDAQVLNGIYQGTLEEHVTLKAAYIGPAGDVTTWAINTRTGAVTEYDNFAFNSFAMMGHKTLAASSNGLYELTGETDSGVSIVARMKGGILQVNGSRYTGFKGIYMGVRLVDTEREFFLKLHAGDGREYVYRVLADNMRTTKVNVGKGLRSRYFQWELVTDADFDLDTIEFVPMLSVRRV